MNVGIINYGMGNIGSVAHALSLLGAKSVVLETPEEIDGVDRVILPGVGAFSIAMANLHNMGWVEGIHHHVRDRAMPMLGICLGMQLLAEESEEGGRNAGLALIPGRVVSLTRKNCGERVPHVGWNEVRPTAGQKLFDGIPACTDFYFVHSYVFEPSHDDHVAGVSEYGGRFTAAVSCCHIAGVQFHPEKSSKAGARLLKNFLG